MTEKPNLLIVEARFYDDLSDRLLEGAKQALEAAGATFDVVTVMGALEVPGAIAMAQNSPKTYDGYVALGVVIRGETYHFEIVANESSRALMDLSVGHSGNAGLAIGNGILTCENEAQSIERADRNRLDKGGFAAKAALTMIALRNKFASRHHD